MEFILDDSDFNYIVEISSNENTLIQMIGGKSRLMTKEQRVDSFWKEMSCKYGFVGDVLTNLENRDARYFMAEGLEIEAMCGLCKMVFKNEVRQGCPKYKEKGCGINQALNKG